MRVLVTGHHGYIGCLLVPLLQEAGHDVTGLDNYLFEGCDFGADPLVDVPAIRKDVRDAEAADLEGFDAIVHLAAISNDPLGDLNPTAHTRSITSHPSSWQGSPNGWGCRAFCSRPRAASTAPPAWIGSMKARR